MESPKLIKRTLSLVLSLALTVGAMGVAPVFANARGNHHGSGNGHHQQEEVTHPEDIAIPDHAHGGSNQPSNRPEKPGQNENATPDCPTRPEHHKPQLPEKPEHNSTATPDCPNRPEQDKPQRPERPGQGELATPDQPQRPGHGHISGNISGGRNHKGSITVELWLSDGEAPAYTLTIENGSYSFGEIIPGEYILKITKHDHVSREFTVTIGSGEMVQDAQLNLKGDVNSDGNVNIGDVARVYAHVRGTRCMENDYEKKCAKVTSGETLNVGDVARIFAHVKGAKKLY